MGLKDFFRKKIFPVASDRRKYPRVPLSVKVTKMTSGAFQFYQATNISVGGVFIKAVEPLPIGSRIKIRITLPGGQIDVEGEVVRIMLEGNHPSGMGVKFINLPEEIRQTIAEYVAKEM